MSTELHAKLKTIAKEKGITLNALINNVMSDYAGTNDNPGFITELNARIEKIENEISKLKNKK